MNKKKINKMVKENKKRLGKTDKCQDISKNLLKKNDKRDLTLSDIKRFTKSINKPLANKVNDLDKLKEKILDKLLDESKVQFYMLFDIIDEFCGEDFIVNNFLKLISDVDDKEFLNNLNKFIDKKIKENNLIDNEMRELIKENLKK